jgi:hypothetical protein
VAAAGEFRFEFEPIEESSGRRYELRLEAPSVPAGAGIGLWATREQAEGAGVLRVDGREHWGDLVFRADATRATVFRRFEHLLRDRPAWLRSRVTLGVVIVLYNWALAAFTWYLLFVEDERAGQQPA